MGHKRPATPSQKVDTAGSSYVGLPASLLTSQAWRHGGDFRMQAIVLAIASHWNGYNNGRIGVSARQIAERIGSANYGANAEALQRALDRELLVCAAVYPKGMRKAPEYRLPWVSTGKHPHFQSATHEYRHWSPDDGRGIKAPRRFKSPAAITATGQLRSPQQGKKQTVAMAATGEPRNGLSPAAIIATPILSPRIGSPFLSLLEGEKSGGPFERPRSMTQDAWMMAQRRASADPATVDLEHVRQLASQFVAHCGRGGQSRLALVAGVPVSTLSKFLHRGGPMPAQHSAELVKAIVRAGFSIERTAA